MCIVAVKNQLAVTPSPVSTHLTTQSRADQLMSQVRGERSRIRPFWLALPLPPVCCEERSASELEVRKGLFESEETKLRDRCLFPFRLIVFRLARLQTKQELN